VIFVRFVVKMISFEDFQDLPSPKKRQGEHEARPGSAFPTFLGFGFGG
jgi:hypothetical protein